MEPRLHACSLDPDTPDLVLRCKHGHTVGTHACLLSLASAPLRAAIELAMNRRSRLQQSPDTTDTSAPDAGHKKRKQRERDQQALPPALLSLPEDSAEVWRHALQLMMPSMDQHLADVESRHEHDTMEPLLLLAHNYHLKLVIIACEDWLVAEFDLRLDGYRYNHAQHAPGGVLHWLELTGRLGLARSHAAVLACVKDCLKMAVLPAEDQPRPYLPDWRRCSARAEMAHMVDDYVRRMVEAGGARPEGEEGRVQWALGQLQAGDVREVLGALVLPAYRAGREKPAASTPVAVTSDSDVPSEHASGSGSE